MNKPIAPEKTEYRDSRTHARMVRWTASPRKDQHLYFTSPSVTVDDRWMTIISERTGHPNLFAINRTTGELHQISDNKAGLLHAYVYPYGGDTGLSKASPSLDAHSGTLVWVQDHAVWTACIGDDWQPARQVCNLPANRDGVKMVSGFTHVSKGGALACVPVAAPEAFVEKTDGQGGQMRAAYRAFVELGLKSLIHVIDLASGKVVDELSMPFWVTHVVFSAADPSRIVFCQEGGGIVSQRTWAWQREATGVPRSELGGRPLFPQPADEWMSHENFEPTGKFIIAHGGKRSRKEGQIADIAFEQVWFDKRDFQGKLLGRYTTDGTRTGHAVMGTDGATVVMDPPQYIWTWNMETGQTKVLCEHGSTAKEQDCHVHPVMTFDQKGVTFTSDRDGVANVYEWRAD
ncbi:MAG: hypothetical protein GC164_09900 [Phycisphaera sp.]|nr:hypothetical protein [Phycisphaera sp.]